MRAIAFVSLAALSLLAACSKPSAPAESAATPEAASPPPPPALTAAQKKTLLADLPAAYQSADLDNGQAKFAICKTCHNTAQGAGAMTGPDLYGIFGRKAGSEPGFAYSDGMKSLGVTWDAASLDKWISDPRAMLPGTKMTYLGMKDAKDRTDVIAYLKTVTSPPPAS
jgi:cytochrome c